MESLYNFIKKQSNLKLLSEQIGNGNKEKAQKTLGDIILDRTFYMGVQKQNNIENFIGYPLKIYIAGPYTPKDANMHDAPRISHENAVNAINEGMGVISRGHFPYIPHLTHFMHLYGNQKLSYEYYAKADIEWLKDCDAILYYHHNIGDSKGADNELKIAIDTGKTVFFSVYEIPRYTSVKKQEI